MLHFEGDKDLPRPPAEVWAKLRDARFLVGCVPNGEVVGEPTQDTAQAKLHPRLAFVKGTLEVTLRVLEAVEPSSIRLSLFSKALGATSEVITALALAPAEGGTRCHWKAEITSLTGLLKLVPGGLIRGAAQKVINDVWAQVDARLAHP